MYSIENYRDSERFNSQYEEIHSFLGKIADAGYNEHFHWGRFDWMMAHPNLDVEMLPRNALFQNEEGHYLISTLNGTPSADFAKIKRWIYLKDLDSI